MARLKRCILGLVRQGREMDAKASEENALMNEKSHVIRDGATNRLDVLLNSDQAAMKKARTRGTRE